MAHGHVHQNLTISERAKLAALKQKYASGAGTAKRMSPSLSPSSTDWCGSASMPKNVGVGQCGQTIVRTVAIIIGILIIYTLKETALDFLALFR